MPLDKEHTSVCRECNCEYSFLLSVSLSSALSTKIMNYGFKTQIASKAQKISESTKGAFIAE